MTKMLRVAALALVVLGGVSVQTSAQTLVGDRLRLTTGPCTIRSGSGSPEGVVTGNRCDEWRDTSTGLVYEKITGTGTTGWSRKVGATAATCASFAGCVAAKLTLDTTLFTQQLRTDTSFNLQQFVNTDGAHLNAFNGGGWMALKLAGGPTQIVGGGLHVGGAATADPGLGNLDVDGRVGLPGYVSQTTGWRIDGLGAADFRYLYTDELHAKKFIADLEQALAGLQIIAKSVGQVGATFTVPAPGSVSTLTMKDLPSAENMAIFESGDYVWLRTFSRASGSLSITNAYGIVTGYADLADKLQTWQFTRLISNGGAMSTGAEVAVDSIVLDVGIPGSGWVETNAVDGIYGINAPYTQIVTWSGDSPISANQTLRTRLGNLRGVTGVTGEYGLIAGTYGATNGTYLRASNQAFELHGIDLKLWNGTTNVYRLDHATPYQSMGNPAPTSYSSGTGCWSGLDGGVFKWRCGDISGGTNYIAWNGSTLDVVGAITVSGTLPDANNALALVGVAGATVVAGAARAALGLDSNGNPILPAAATPSGTGLFLGGDYMGFYASGAWKTYMDNSGNFYLGGTGGALQWNGTTLTIAATMSGNGANITSISGGNITTGSVTATQIAANTITAAKIAAGTITATELAADSVTSAKITAGTIVASDIASGTITATQISAGTISSSEIAADTITGANILAGTIEASDIAANTITAAKIAAGTLTATELAAGSVTAAKISVSTLDAISATLGTISAGSLTLGSSGYVRQGQTAYNTGTGFWLGDVGGTPKFSIGSSSGNRMTWDGSTLVVSAMQVNPIATISGGVDHALNNSGNNYNTIIATGSGSTFLRSIDNGLVGQIVTVSNHQTSGTLTISNEYWGTSAPINFRCPGGVSVVLNPGGTITAQNDGVDWYVLTVNVG